MKRHTMSDKETNRLVLLAQAGDTAAADVLVKEHFGLVARVLRNLRRPIHHMEREDLEQEGRLGLWDAIRHYDAGRGATFGTFATWRVQARIRRAVSLDRLIHVPVHQVFAAGAGATDFAAVTASLDAHIGQRHKQAQFEDENLCLGDNQRADDNTEAEIMSRIDYAAAVALVATLPTGQREVVTLVFGLDGGGERPMQEVADTLGLSRRTAYTHCATALRRLRNTAKQEEETP